MNDAFSGWQRVRVHALLAGQRIDLRAVYRSDSLAIAPLAIPAGEHGIAVLFRYGVVVMFNLQVVEEAAFLVSLKSVVGDALDAPEREEATIVVQPDAEERVDASGVIHLREVTAERLLVVADVLAKSVILDYDEHRVARVFDRIEPVAQALRRRGGGRVAAQQLLDHIGDVLITQHRMVGRVEITEKPELLWDRPELERLYLRLREEYELPERDRALTRKLDLIAQTATTALGLLQARRSLRVEWYIVILIVVEIVLTVYQMVLARSG
jgi:required for meiotic nuclear division protein 1